MLSNVWNREGLLSPTHSLTECRLKDPAFLPWPITLSFSAITVIRWELSGSDSTWTCPGLKRPGQEGVADWCGDHWHLQRLILKGQPDNPTCNQRIRMYACILFKASWLSFHIPKAFQVASPLQRAASCGRHTSVRVEPLRSLSGLTSATCWC